MTAAWYDNERAAFLRDEPGTVVDTLTRTAVGQGLFVEPDQHDEWLASVDILQSQLADRASIIREALAAPDLAEYRHVILEYDLRRRGLRLDCVLLGDGIIVVLEFKRTTVGVTDREQVTNYCINLVEFHEETQRACNEGKCIVLPVIALTEASNNRPPNFLTAFHDEPWSAVIRTPLLCDRSTLHDGLRAALDARRSKEPIDRARWLKSRFAPSSTIIDAAISLFGQHDVSAINAHAAHVEDINRCTQEIADVIVATRAAKQNRIIFVSGAPGAGKTLVGLKLAFHPEFRRDAVFVTGNAPLVDVLEAALRGSYQRQGRRRSDAIQSGYRKTSATVADRAEAQVRNRHAAMATYKIVKAHAFLGERGKGTGSADGSIVIFDEAQRTYKEGREVLRRRLEENEANLILKSLEGSYPDGAVVVALVGHNQAINRGELGVAAWFEAAAARRWRYSISDTTLAASSNEERALWANADNRDTLRFGHLPHSLRFYRNSAVEAWVGKVLEEDPAGALRLAKELERSGDTVWLTRDLSAAKAWARARRVGDERAGLIASGQGRRLAAEGLRNLSTIMRHLS